MALDETDHTYVDKHKVVGDAVVGIASVTAPGFRHRWALGDRVRR